MSEPEAVFFPLDEFLGELIHRGFCIGVDTHLRLREYLDWFMQNTDRSPRTLKYQLAALLCHDLAEQEQFYELFEQKVVPFFSATPSGTLPEPPEKLPPETQQLPGLKETAELHTIPASTYVPVTQPVLTEGKSGPVRVELKFPTNELRIWNLAEIEQPVRLLREKEWATVLEWDIPASIDSTVRAGGMPTFKLRRRKRAPQYLMLIDQRSPRDHLAGLYADLAAELNRRDVDTVHFFYDHTPYRCWKDRRAYGTYTTIESLQSEFPGSRLLIVGEPESLLDLPRLRPSNLAADLLDTWPQTALLCTRPTAEWGNAELALCQIIPVVPANDAGLASLTLQWAATEVYRPQYWKIKCPEGTVPPVRLARPQDADRVLENLRYYLGRDGYYWLCAVALYPELYYELTILLHDESIPPPPGVPPSDWDMNRVWWTNLLNISRIDWFRRGNIPLPAREQLRAFFEARVPPEQRQQVWEQLAQLLEFTSAPPGSFAADNLQVTLEWYKTERQLADPTLPETLRSQLRAAIQEKMQSSAINDPLARRVQQRSTPATIYAHPLFTGHVTTDVTDIKSGPSESDPVIGQLQKNTRVDIFVISRDRGWYRIGENWWVNAQNIKTEQIFRRQKEMLLQTGRVSATSLNIRSGPSVSDPVIGRLEQDVRVNIFEISEDHNWYRIGENWWVNAGYVETAQVTQTITETPFRILWVDDNPENNRQERAALQDRFGVSIIVSTGMEDALGRLAVHVFDLVISDAVRGEDHEAGMRLLQTMQERRLTTPFVVYTSVTNFDYFRDIFLKAGAAGVFQDSQQLLNFVGSKLKVNWPDLEPSQKGKTPETKEKRRNKKSLHIFMVSAPANEAMKDELAGWLMPLQQLYQFKLQEEASADSDSNLFDLNRKDLETADVVLFLVSPELLNSSYSKQSMDLAVERASQGNALLIPVILHDCPWEKTPLSRFQAANREPIGTSTDRIGALYEVCWQIIMAIGRFRNEVTEQATTKGAQKAPPETRFETKLRERLEKIRWEQQQIVEEEPVIEEEMNAEQAAETEPSVSGQEENAPPVQNTDQPQQGQDKSPEPPVTKEQIQQLIAEGRSEEALALLAQHSKEALLLQARYNEGKKQYNNGLIEFSEWQRMQAQINYAALELGNTLPAEIQTRVRNLIAKNRMGEALQALVQALPAHLKNDALLLQNRLQELERKERLDMISFDDANIQEVEITKAALDLTGQISTKAPLPSTPSNSGSSPAQMKILFLTANPTDMARIQTDKEYRIIENELKKSRQGDNIQILRPKFSVTLPEIIEAINEKPNIIHFSGHGEENGIIISTEDNTSQLVPLSDLQRLIAPLKGILQIIVLNTSDSAELAKVLSQLGPYVVGHNMPLSDPAAISFSKGFYNGLGQGKHFYDAFNDAMIVLLSEHPSAAPIIEVWKDGQKLDL